MKKNHQIAILLFLTGMLFAQDITAPVISSTAPANNAIVNTTQVS